MVKKFYSDAGHGWLAVKKKELVELGIEKEITGWSYMKGGTAYLEEDQDFGTYLKAQKERGVVIVVQGKYHEHSPIRGYEGYCAE